MLVWEIIVAQGYDAGAHTGTIGTFSLVPQIVEAAGDVPVLVAGVATGRHIAAALVNGRSRRLAWDRMAIFGGASKPHASGQYKETY